ncbi:hypothetical protein DRN74_01225 [Candidatus Micrarchaeota archaeon]|nr:MAG: hypothetical protein DRN74_01225 [Candidatus Micrarchaeota archaeon]
MDLEELLRTIYPKQGKYRFAAASLIKAAGSEERGLDAHGLNKLCVERGISRATMQKVFVHLRALGMIERRNARYYVIKDFASALRRMGDAWKRIVNEKRFDFDESKIKISI